MITTVRSTGPKRGYAAPKCALILAQGCCEYFWTGLLLGKQSHVTPIVSDFCAFCFKQTVEFLQLHLPQQWYVRQNRKQFYYTILCAVSEKNGMKALTTSVERYSRVSLVRLFLCGYIIVYCEAMSQGFSKCGTHTTSIKPAIVQRYMGTVRKNQKIKNKHFP